MIADRWEAYRKYEFATFPGGYSPSETKGDCYFDYETAGKVIEWSEKHFRHWRGHLGGELITLEEWQRDIIASLFGWKKPNGKRRYRIAYVEIPRGNGKSTLCALIVGILLFLDGEPGAEIVSAAGSREQAREVFNPFNYNCLTSPTLKARTKSYVNSVSHIDNRNGSVLGTYKSVSSDANTQHGGAPHGVIFDELHVQKTRDLWDVYVTGAKKRLNSLIVAITTAGYNRLTICYEQHDKAKRVRDGVIADETFLPVIYAADENDDWQSPDTWRKANPNLNVSMMEDGIAELCQEAKHSPAFENTFKRLNLNIWTQQATRFIPMDLWRQPECNLVVDENDLRGMPCWGGIDLSSTQDLTAWVLVFRSNDTYFVLPRMWVAEAAARKAQQTHSIQYFLWEKQGYIEIVPGNTIDYPRVHQKIVEDCNLFGPSEIAFDPHGARHLAQMLQDEDGQTIKEFPQNYKNYNEALDFVLKLLLDKKLVHGGHPVLQWNADSLEVKKQLTTQHIMPCKPEGDSQAKIDGIVAMTMALALAMTSPEPTPLGISFL